jgi:hypothetical protein
MLPPASEETYRYNLFLNALCILYPVAKRLILLLDLDCRAPTMLLSYTDRFTTGRRHCTIRAIPGSTAARSNGADYSSRRTTWWNCISSPRVTTIDTNLPFTHARLVTSPIKVDNVYDGSSGVASFVHWCASLFVSLMNISIIGATATTRRTIRPPSSSLSPPTRTTHDARVCTFYILYWFSIIWNSSAGG